MYNSLVVRFLVKIWDSFIYGYNSSLIKKIADMIKKAVTYLFFGSVTKDIFVSDKSIIEMSLFYKIYVKIVDIISKWIKILNKYIKGIANNSIIYKSSNSLFKDDIEVANTIFSFFLFFGIGIIFNNVLRGLWSGRSYLVATVLVIISIIGMLMKNRYSEILKGSFVFQFIMSLFSIDEGGINWW